MSNFWQRAITGVFFVIILAASILIDLWTLSGLFLLVTLIGINEYHTILNKGKKPLPSRMMGFFVATICYTSSVLAAADIIPTAGMAIGFASIAFLPIAELFRGKTEDAFVRVTNAFTGQLWITVPFSLLVTASSLGGVYNGWTVLGFFMILWTNDTGAYVTGRTFGRHKLAPKISPGKTIEGFLGGVVLAMVLAWFMGDISGMYSRNQWLVIAAIIGVFSNAGDLVESLLKRSSRVKDSGNLLPGHGGVLDRFDGVLLSIPVILAYLLISNLL